MMNDFNFDDILRSTGNPQRGAKYALIILTLINLLNYMDRFVPSATKDLYKKELELSDSESSAPLSAFMVMYMLTSPVFGMLSDKELISRKVLLAVGVVLWSVATGVTYYAVEFWSFMACRMFVGIGEAAYSTIAPSLISDLYPPDQRNRAMTVFFMATPVGAALGYILGGILGQQFGWRAAFLMCGFPGVLVALLIFFIQDPGHGVYENPEEDQVPWIDAIKSLVKNKDYMFSLGGFIAITWALGGMADWLPTFILRSNNEMDIETSAIISGAATVFGGIGGTVLGSVMGDKAKDRGVRNPYLGMSAFFTLLSSLFMIATIALIKTPLSVVAFFITVSQVLAWCYMGPINALQANVVSAQIRARAFSLTILMIHIFGDGISPIIIGFFSDKVSLTFGVSLVPIFMIIAGIIWGLGWWHCKDSPDHKYKHLLEEDTSFDMEDDSDFSRFTS